MGTRVLSLGIKRPRREADHSPTSSVKVKNAWSYTSTLPIHLHDVVLIWNTGATLYLYLLPLVVLTSRGTTLLRIQSSHTEKWTSLHYDPDKRF
jgi:hypothetical protein